MVLNGEWEAAEHQLGELVAEHPNEVEAWLLLGMNRWSNPTPGGLSRVDARKPFERVLALVPEYKQAQTLLFHVVAIDHDWETVS